MAIVYDWVISQLECYTVKDKLPEVVFNVHWRYTAKDGEYYADVYGSQALNADDITDFIPYEELTKEQVVLWLEEAIGEDKIASFQSSLQASIDSLKNPPVVTPPLPWN
jgi:hypothetical protein